jgi:hypothetical protein
MTSSFFQGYGDHGCIFTDGGEGEPRRAYITPTLLSFELTRHEAFFHNRLELISVMPCMAISILRLQGQKASINLILE